MEVYVVDSNFFIQAHRITYPLDVALSFWDKIRELAGLGLIISIDKVKNELYQNNDELKCWCEENLPIDFFKSSEESIEEYIQVVNWAMSKREHFLYRALDEFLDADEADAWIIAYSLKNNKIITTYEKSQPSRRNKIKIPEPCEYLNVSYVDTMDMFRQLNVQF